MSKYAALGAYLKKQSGNIVRLSFAEIEQLIGGSLPASARRYRAWWSNNSNNSVITKAWLGAGFRSQDVDMAGETLVFARAKEPALGLEEGRTMYETDLPDGVNLPVHPLFGFLKGFLKIPPGEDLTKPAEPDWEEITLQSWDEKL